ncbi:hypothetical protein SDC9_144835 [bioreactor metagenome]|uniref:Uncharacterized protein n=1 Tax=bioreactor metagenome TaxID=1076179 RepID=A0A645E935_9ZZZZ
MVCTCVHTVSQRRQRIHLVVSRTMEKLERSSSSSGTGAWKGSSSIPISAERAFNSQDSRRLQNKQLCGWLDSMSSNMVLRASTAREVSVLTTIPSTTVVEQEGAKLRRPSISTKQTRQDAPWQTTLTSGKCK